MSRPPPLTADTADSRPPPPMSLHDDPDPLASLIAATNTNRRAREASLKRKADEMTRKEAFYKSQLEYAIRLK